MKQRTDEWFAIRAGKVTASRIADLMAKTKSGSSASRKNYLAEKLAERLTGEPYDSGSFTTAAMQRGNDVEPIARAEYEFAHDVQIEEIAFCVHPEIADAGASPDGLVGADGMIQIKCPNTATHLATLASGKIDRKYSLQMQWEMRCAGRTWSDFVSFDNRLPSPIDRVEIRLEYDQDIIDEIEREVKLFLLELDELEADIRARM